MELLIDQERGEEVFTILNNCWKEQKGIFDKRLLPQNHWDLQKITRNEKDLSLFLFFAALFMRGGIVSDTAFKWVFALWRNFPELFDPKWVTEELTPSRIATFFRAVAEIFTEKKDNSFNPIHLHLAEHSSAWYRNSAYLADNWQGNPLSAFEGIYDFYELFDKIVRKNRKASEKGIQGMRLKIFSLLAIWYQEFGLIYNFPCPIPVDFHALRVLICTEVVTFKNVAPFRPYSKKHSPQTAGKIVVRVSEKGVTDPIANWSYSLFINGMDISHEHINPALWILSKYLCRRNHQNTSKTVEGKVILVDPEELRKNPMSWPRNYKDPCVFCPVQKFCNHAIPAAQHYDTGHLVIMEKVHYKLQPTHSGIDWRHYSARKQLRNIEGARLLLESCNVDHQK